MSLLASENLFTAIDVHARRIALGLTLPPQPGADGTPEQRLSAESVRATVANQLLDETIRDHALRRMLDIARIQRDPWELIAIWALLPRLQAMTSRISTRTRSEPAEIRSELSLGATLAIRETELSGPHLGKRVWAAVYGHGWAAVRRKPNEVPCPDDELTTLLSLTEAIRHTSCGDTAVADTRRIATRNVSTQTIRGELFGAIACRRGVHPAHKANQHNPHRSTS